MSAIDVAYRFAHKGKPADANPGIVEPWLLSHDGTTHVVATDGHSLAVLLIDRAMPERVAALLPDGREVTPRGALPNVASMIYPDTDGDGVSLGVPMTTVAWDEIPRGRFWWRHTDGAIGLWRSAGHGAGALDLWQVLRAGAAIAHLSDGIPPTLWRVLGCTPDQQRYVVAPRRYPDTVEPCPHVVVMGLTP